DATCTIDGTETADCDNGCDIPHTQTDKDSALGHDYTVYVGVKTEATYTSNRVDTYKCERCTDTEDREIANTKLERKITFSDSLEVDGDNVYGKVNHATTMFNFNETISVEGYTFQVYDNEFGGSTGQYPMRKVPLAEGENVYYIFVMQDGIGVKTYMVSLYRNHMYTVSFGEDAQAQQVEEGFLAQEPTTQPSKTGYTFGGWDFDFTTPIEQDMEISAIWTVNSYTIKVNTNMPAAGTVNGAGTYDYGTEIVLSVETNYGYKFQGWYNSSLELESAATELEITVSGNMTYLAVWSEDGGTEHICSFVDYTPNYNATCTENGTETAYCIHGCGAFHNREIANSALGHSYTNYIPNGDATCLEDGTETASCDNGCGIPHTRTDEVSALGHEYTTYVGVKTPATCTTNRIDTYKCVRCAATEDREIADTATGHSYTNYTSNGDATCTADGTETADCDNGCGIRHIRTDEDSALGHDYTVYTSVHTPATCTTNRVDTFKCERCNATEDREIIGTATGHSYTDYIYNEDATYDSDGTKTANCDNGCGE
ncbi:MAG: InlB B-repeat-containing protein, partial [Clostridia bacterium]|nr:InlB B-repeat-containing protein [Clostridia bacterium]